MTELLKVDRLHAGYGDVPVLNDVSLVVARGEIVSIVGANGAGKTTLLSAICGLLSATSGSIWFDGKDITKTPAHAVPGLGLTMVPEGGRLFPFLTVQENLELGGYSQRDSSRRAARLREVMDLFPILGERREQMAGKLSGGERQMCAVARAIISRPSLLMLDEPSVGLSPLMVERILDIVQTLVREENLTVLIVEQNVAEALEISARGYVLDHGQIAHSGKASDLLADRRIQETYMGL